MKPNEFDDLLRKKFDQNDFAYDPGNWSRLAEKLENRAKKRSLIMWAWMPLAGIAASVVMTAGIISFLSRQVTVTPAVNMEYAQTHPLVQAGEGLTVSIPATKKSFHYSHKKAIPKTNKPAITIKDDIEEWFAIKLKNTITVPSARPFTSLNEEIVVVEKKKKAALAGPHETFNSQPETKASPKLSVILSGGINHGSQGSGYLAGATVRRMITDKVYVESDLGFASSGNIQSTDYLKSSSRTVTVPASVTARQGNTAGKISSAEGSKTTTGYETTYSLEQHNQSYNLYYAQITPSIGYKLLKKLSVGIGPDFQQVLADNRPAPSTLDPGNIQIAPILDIGFVGKTEYALTNRIKAAVYYRKGINDLISPSDRYIERDYLQFQLKCVIFNK